MEKPTHDELNALLSKFYVDQKSYVFRILNNGFINDTYLVSDALRPRYILQRINHTVFNNIDGLMANIGLALEHLNALDYQKIELIPTRSGKTHFSDSSGHWRIMTYIENSITHNTTTNAKIAFEAGRIIGEFHLLLQNAPADDFEDTIPQFHHLKLREKQFHEALSHATGEKIAKAAAAISFTKATLVHLKTVEVTDLAVRICHNDTKLNNILFSKETDTALCLIDLDTLMKGHFMYDFGDAVRTIVNSASEDERDHQKIGFDKKLFSAFIEGLATKNSFLSEKEVESLAFGAVLMPFLHGIRALTDYLNNNSYYKVTYENQNLDRCLSLFDFTKKARNEFESMKKLVQQKMLAN